MLSSCATIIGSLRPSSLVNLPSLPPLPQVVCAQEEKPAADLRANKDYWQETVTVSDSNGAFVHGLKQDNFTVLQNGQPLKIVYFLAGDRAPTSVGILVDTSGSMKPKIEQTRAAITDLVSGLDPRDDVFLVGFATEPYILATPTTDRQAIIDRLRFLNPWGRTALYDSLATGLRLLNQSCYERKVLVLITDGVDNSSKADITDAVLQAQQSDALIYSIWIGKPGSHPFILGPFIFGSGEDVLDPAPLQELSAATGGTFSLVSVQSANLREPIARMKNEWLGQYTIGFISTGSDFTVEAKNPFNLSVRQPSHTVPR